MLLRIIRHDTDSYAGREYSPLPMDIGTLVTAIKLDTMIVVAEQDLEPVMYDDDRLHHMAQDAAHYEIIEQEPCLARMWTCLTKDGRVVQLHDNEVELFRS